MEFDRKIVTYLKEWRGKRERKPLILRGARQVGKTSAVLLFGKKYFENLIHINLEKTEHSRLFPQEITLADFEKTVNLSFGQPLTSGKTLLFLDEIQEAPHLLKLLRFFFEERPELHLIAAGSLFEVRLKEEALPFPVGRVEFAYLYPLDFFEFLQARDQGNLFPYLKNFDFKEKIPLGIHEKLLSLFNEYALIGGMPEAVKIYLNTRNPCEVNNVYSHLFTSFKDDVYKYTSIPKSKYVGFVLAQAPLFAGLPITYEKFGGSMYKSREMHHAFELLEKAMLLYQVKATKSTSLPLLSKLKKPAKLIFLDTGLVNYLMGTQEEFVRIKDLTDFYQGRIAEQIVGQHLFASFVSHVPNIFYWYKKKGSEAEVDFCFLNQGKIVGVEVKSGTRGRLKSGYEFLKATQDGKVIRVYSGQFKRENNFISLPFYLLPRLREL